MLHGFVHHAAAQVLHLYRQLLSVNSAKNYATANNPGGLHTAASSLTPCFTFLWTTPLSRRSFIVTTRSEGSLPSSAHRCSLSRFSGCHHNEFLRRWL